MRNREQEHKKKIWRKKKKEREARTEGLVACDTIQGKEVMTHKRTQHCIQIDAWLAAPAPPTCPPRAVNRTRRAGRRSLFLDAWLPGASLRTRYFLRAASICLHLVSSTAPHLHRHSP